MIREMNGPILAPSDPKYFSLACRQISKESRTKWNRLLSIFYDAQFVQYFSTLVPFPIIANLRCGVWYCPDAVERCYFKSTDGHQGNWSFSCSRLNLHVLTIVALHGGGIIVDATRKGKLFPDALSKTVPIWIWVMNAVLGLESKLVLYEGIPASEYSCIEERLEGWKKSFLDLGINVSGLKKKMKKPMKPLWISQDSLESGSSFKWICKNLPFYPIILLSCSSNQKHIPFRLNSCQHDSFEYVAGAADDEESWSMGLTSHLFWKHHKDIIAHGSLDLENFVMHTCNNEVRCLAQQGPHFVLTRNGVFKYDVSKLEKETHVGWVDCGCSKGGLEERVKNQKQMFEYLWCPITNEKKDKTSLLKQLPQILSFISTCLENALTVIIYNEENVENAFSIVIAAVIALYRNKDDDSFVYPNSGHPQVTKQSVRKIVNSLVSEISFQCPHRHTLKQIFNYFHKGNLLGLKLPDQ